jgi:hypothetical protein
MHTGSTTSAGGNYGNRGAGGDMALSGGGSSELRFEVEPTDIVAVRGQPAILDCRASFQPQQSGDSGSGTSQRPPDVYWIKDGTKLKYDSRRLNGCFFFLFFGSLFRQ